MKIFDSAIRSRTIIIDFHIRNFDEIPIGVAKVNRCEGPYSAGPPDRALQNIHTARMYVLYHFR